MGFDGGIRRVRLRGRSWVFWAGLVALLLPSLTQAAKKKYTYEEDPIRLGNQALVAGRLDEAKAKFDEAIAGEYDAYKAHYGLAEILIRQGSYFNAEPLYRQALEGRKAEGSADFPEAHAGLGLLLFRVGRTAEAKIEFDQALKESGGIWEAVYGQGRLAILEGDVGAAEKAFKKGAGRKGLAEGQDKFHYGMALVSRLKGDLDAAEKSALQALNQNPTEPEYGETVAEIFTQRGAPTLAIDAYKKAFETPGMVPTAPALHKFGKLYQQVRDYNEAKRRYEDAIQVDSTYAPALKDLGALYALGEQWDKSASVYLAYVQIERGDVDGFLGLAKACNKSRRYKQGLEAAKTAYGLDSTLTDVRLAYARAAANSKDLTDKARAKRLFMSVSDSTKYEPNDYLLLGRLDYEEKSFMSARRNLIKAVELDSTQTEGFLTLGMISLTEQKADSAVLFFDRAIALQPNNGSAYLNRGIALSSQKRFPEAIASLRRAGEISPDYQAGRLVLGQTLISADSTAAAIEVFKVVIAAEPTNGKALRFLGFCYLKQQRYSEAAKALEAATAAEPGSADGWAFLGNAYLGLATGNPSYIDKAEEAFKKALQVKPDHAGAKSGLDVIKKHRASQPKKP